MMLSKFIPVMVWSFLTFSIYQDTKNLLKYQRHVIREIRLIRKGGHDYAEDTEYELMVKVKGSMRGMIFDLKDVNTIEIKDKLPNWPSSIFTKVSINDTLYVIPFKTIVVYNDNLYSKFLTGRIKNFQHKE